MTCLRETTVSDGYVELGYSRDYVPEKRFGIWCQGSYVYSETLEGAKSLFLSKDLIPKVEEADFKEKIGRMFQKVAPAITEKLHPNTRIRLDDMSFPDGRMTMEITSVQKWGLLVRFHWFYNMDERPSGNYDIRFSGSKNPEEFIKTGKDIADKYWANVSNWKQDILMSLDRVYNTLKTLLANGQEIARTTESSETL